MRPAYGKGTVMIAELLLGLLIYLIPAALFGPASLAAWLAPIVFCVAVETGVSEILAFMVSMIAVSAAYMLAVYLPWALEVERLHRVDCHGHSDQGDEDGPRHLRRVP